MFAFYSNFCEVCKKKSKPPYGIRKKNEEILNAHISQMAVVNLIKFAVWRTLPGGQL